MRVAAAVPVIPAVLHVRWPVRADWLLVPMDDVQADHLKAYGLTFRAIQRGVKAEWLLNYRGGSFLLPNDAAAARDAALNGITVEGLSDAAVTQIRGEIASSNMDAVPLEKAPKVAVYVPPFAAPWDDAVTMALNYAGIEYDKLWDPEVMEQGLKTYDWLHLHHEDFTGQYSKFYLNYAGAPWLAEMVARNREVARQLGYANVPALKKAVAQQISAFVERGGFLFAMCTATETLDLALAAANVDIAASLRRRHADRAWRERQAGLEQGAGLPGRAAGAEPHHCQCTPTSTATRSTRSIAGSSSARFTLFGFSAKIDPVPTMLVQNHRDVDPRFLRPHHVVHPEDAQARRHRAGRRAGCPVGQVHPWREGAGHLDLLRRSRSRRSAAPDR